jgi:ubiquinone/menaquinone biosynthesis C-methylase UbiE
LAGTVQSPWPHVALDSFNLQSLGPFGKKHMSTWWRDFLRRFHPEGIPWPGSVLYNAISQTEVFNRHYALVADHVGLYCRAGSILDVGTGPGWLLVALRRSLPALDLVGVDISPAMVATARENMKRAGCAAAIDLRVAAAESLPFPDDTFDAVVSTGSLHHWKHPLAALNEAHRVLKPGGYGLVYDLVRKLPPAIVEVARREFGTLRACMLWLHSFEEPFYSVQDMEALVPTTSFESVQTQFVGVLCCLILRKGTTDAAP